MSEESKFCYKEARTALDAMVAACEALVAFALAIQENMEAVESEKRGCNCIPQHLNACMGKSLAASEMLDVFEDYISEHMRSIALHEGANPLLDKLQEVAERYRDSMDPAQRIKGVN
jgi:hypothetical protein